MRPEYQNQKNQPLRPMMSRVLLVCGSGRNTGKTVLAASIIRHFSASHRIAAIKISMHHHDHPGNLEMLEDEYGYKIFRDIEFSDKDSGRFLRAGAVPSLYIETTDQFLYQAFNKALNHCPPSALIVCESGGLIRVVRPGIMIFVQQEKELIPENKTFLRDQADLVVENGMGQHQMVISRIGTGQCEWVIQ
jgi:Ni2+-binding GTPase involved in maturation of urease and hydrogenase